MPPRAEVPTDIVESYGRREVTYSLKTRDLAEAVCRVKLASVETMKVFDDHRRKVVAEKRAVVIGPVDPFLAAGEALAANDDADERAELAAYSTLASSQLSLFAELHRSMRLEHDDVARFDGFKAVRPGPGSDMLLFTADDLNSAEYRFRFPVIGIVLLSGRPELGELPARRGTTSATRGRVGTDSRRTATSVGTTHPFTP